MKRFDRLHYPWLMRGTLITLVMPAVVIMILVAARWQGSVQDQVESATHSAKSEASPEVGIVPSVQPTVLPGVGHTITSEVDKAGQGGQEALVSVAQTGNPFSRIPFFVDPDSHACQTASQWRQQGRTADAASLSKICSSAWAQWLTYGDGSDAAGKVARATKAGAMPVLVMYNIPGRDCGQYSAGGANYEGYKAWVDRVVSGIGQHPAVVILEPDALGLDCLQTDSTYSLLRYAVNGLSGNQQAAVYIVASQWIDPATMADRLRQAGVEKARGFAVNVSGFETTDRMLAYGKQLSSLLGGKHFIIDTSRNGLGPLPPNVWCNPSGRALGERPTYQTGQAMVDAYFWIKIPGESDGNCNGGPSAGDWWPEYALGLAQRAAY